MSTFVPHQLKTTKDYVRWTTITAFVTAMLWAVSFFYDEYKQAEHKKQEAKLRSWAESQLGKPYDYTALAPLNVLIPRTKKQWKNDSQWMCSEFCAYGLELVGYKFFSDDFKKVKPSDFKKGDKVKVITGKSKGKIGDVIKVFPKENRALVSGVNLAKVHLKPSRNNEGGISQKELPIHISNLSHIDPKTDEITKVGIKTLENGKKVRFAKKSGEIISKEGK